MDLSTGVRRTHEVEGLPQSLFLVGAGPQWLQAHESILVEVDLFDSKGFRLLEIGEDLSHTVKEYTGDGCGGPVFSPDGERVTCFNRRELWLGSLGQDVRRTRKVAENVDVWLPPQWIDNSRFVFRDDAGVSWVSDCTEGEPQALLSVPRGWDVVGVLDRERILVRSGTRESLYEQSMTGDGSRDLLVRARGSAIGSVGVTVSPDRRWVAFFRKRVWSEAYDIYVLELSTRESYAVVAGVRPREMLWLE